MPAWLGKTIGKVRIDKFLARGGMGEVYLGTHLTLDRPVAVKVLHSFIEEEPDLLVRFHREAKVVAGLRHSNIVQIYDFDAIDGHPYIVMEYLNGPPLATYLCDLDKRNERIPLPQVARILKALTSALDYAHEQGVIHRDIKPGNIMLHGKAIDFSPDAPVTNDVEAVLMDFGLVRIANTASQTISGMISGTPAYMSPEQAKGERVDYRTDIYSLGIVLYEMLAGRVPFKADSTLSLIYKQIHDPPQPITGISPAIQKVIDRALAKKPEDRYQTSGSLADDFILAAGASTGAAAGAAPGVTATSEEPLEEPIKIAGDLPVTPAKADETVVRMNSAIKKPKPDAVGKAAGSPARIPSGIFAGIGLLVLAIGAIFLFSRFLAGSAAGSPSPSPEVTGPAVASSATEAVLAPDKVTAQNTEAATPVAGNGPGEAGGLPDALEMVEVPAGDYVVGSANPDDYHSALLNVSLEGFWIDQYQVTFAEFQEYLQATGTAFSGILGEGKHPVRGVPYEQALAYCTWENKRLPSEAEWEAAGRGAGAAPQVYPWGNDSKAGGEAASLPDQGTYEVGSLPFNKSPFGVYDMVGNIWEWVGEPYTSVPDGLHILRGGRFGLPILPLSYRIQVTSSDNRYLKFAGFRCAADQVK